MDDTPARARPLGCPSGIIPWKPHPNKLQCAAGCSSVWGQTRVSRVIVSCHCEKRYRAAVCGPARTCHFDERSERHGPRAVQRGSGDVRSPRLEARNLAAAKETDFSGENRPRNDTFWVGGLRKAQDDESDAVRPRSDAVRPRNPQHFLCHCEAGLAEAIPNTVCQMQCWGLLRVPARPFGRTPSQ